MTHEQREWLNQFWRNFGLKEFFKLGIAISGWIFLTIILIAVFPNAICATILLLVPFMFPFFVLRWQPVYSAYRKILGNENLPAMPIPRSTAQMRPWWSYLPGLWFSVLTLLLFYFAIKYFLK